MASHPRTLLSFAAAALALAAPSALAATVTETFTLPNGTNMGPSWQEIEGNTAIENNMGKGASGPGNKGWMVHKTLTGHYADSVCELDFYLGSSSDAIVLLAGMNTQTWGGISAKLQDNNGDGLFDRVFFEQGFNAGSWGAGAPVHYDLLAPIAEGHMKLRFENFGDTAVVEISSPATSIVETFSAAGITGFSFPIYGESMGIGHSGAPRFDNWKATAVDMTYGTGCKGTGNFVPTLNGGKPIAGSMLTIDIAKGLGGAPAIFFFGLTQGQLPIGPTGCSLLVQPLLTPSFSLPLGGVGPGKGALSVFGVLPPETAGVTFTMQVFVVDAGVPHGYSATNGLLLPVQ